MAGTSLSFDLFTRDRSTKALRSVSDEAGKTRKAFGAMASGTVGAAKLAGKAVAGLAIGAGVAAVAFGKAAVDEAREAEKVGKTTAAIIKATGGAAKVSAADVGKLSEKLSMKAGVDDEVIQTGANLLLTFKNVRNEAGKGSAVFDRATAAAVDLSSAGFGSVDGSAKMLGKALNDPLKGISALGRAGVTFTEQQKKTIAGHVEEGNVLKAQKIILKEVESQVGGVAAANATAGDKAKVAWGNFQEAVGTMLLPIIDKLLTSFAKILPVILDLGKAIGDKLKPTFKAVSETVKGFFATFSGGGGASLKEFIGRLLELGKQAAPIVMDAFQTVGAIIKRLATTVFPIVSEIVKTVVGAFKKAAPDIMSAMNSIKSIVVNVLGIIKAAWNKFGPFIIPVVKTVFGTIFKVIGGVLKAVAGVVKTIMAVIKGDWSGAWKGIKQVLAGIWQAIKGLVSGAVKVIKTVLSAAWTAVKAVAKRAWDGVKTVLSNAWDAIKRRVSDRVDDVKRALSKAWQAIKSAVSAAWRKVKETITGVWDGIKRGVADRVDDVKRGLSRAWQAIKDAVGNAWRWVKERISDTWDGIKRGVSDKLDGLKRGLSNAWQAIKDAVGNAWRAVKERIFDAFTSIGRKINDFKDGAPRKLLDAGKALLRGLKNGMFEALGKAKEWFGDIGRKIIGGVKDFFGISSPSKVFAGFGGNMIDGLIKGMLSRNPAKMAGKVFGSMKNALQHLVSKGLVKAKDLSGKAIEALGGLGVSGASGSAQQYAKALLPSYGWGQGIHWDALKDLWQNESGWNPLAHNPTSGAHGIPQSLPASKMASEGADYYTNAKTQIRWGLGYIRDRYGSPMSAWSFWNSQNPHWYGNGLDGGIFKRPTLIGVGENGPERVDVTPLNRPRRGGSQIVEMRLTVDVPGNGEMADMFAKMLRTGKLRLTADGAAVRVA